MSLTLFIPSGTAPAVVQVPSGIIFERTGETGTIFSGCKFDADGSIYARTFAGAWQVVGTWLVAGAASGYWISRTIDTGSLTTDAGAGPLVLSTDREYDVQMSSNGEKNSAVTFSISSDVSGSPVVANGTYIFFAVRGLV